MKRAVIAYIVFSVQVIVGATMWPAASATATLSPAMLGPMRAFASGAATMNAATVTAVCTHNASIVDEFAPYTWSGPAAPSRYVASLRSWAAANKLTAVRVRIGEPRYFDVSGSASWASMPATYSFLANGRPAAEDGVWVFVLARTGAAWKIASVAWATTSLKQH
jgi:hypothetical protein